MDKRVKYGRLAIGEYYDYPDRKQPFESVSKSVNIAMRKYGKKYKISANHGNNLRVTRVG